MNDDCMEGEKTQGNQTLEDDNSGFGDEKPVEVKKENKYDFLKASPAEFKTFSYEDQLYWVYAQFVFKRNYLLFDEVEKEVVVEEEDEVDSESSEESESEESESEEDESSEEESDDEPNSKESKRNDNRGYGPRGLVYPTAAA